MKPAQISNIIYSVLGKIPPILIAFAVIGILYGITKLVWHGNDETERKEGRYFIFWGIIGLFVMVSIWGLVGILLSTLHLNQDLNPLQEVNKQTEQRTK